MVRPQRIPESFHVASALSVRAEGSSLGGASCKRVEFKSAEEVSQWLITEQLISTVPWDEAGPYLRFSVTFVVRTFADESRVLGEIERRLGQVKFEF